MRLEEAWFIRNLLTIKITGFNKKIIAPAKTLPFLYQSDVRQASSDPALSKYLRFHLL